jgi:DNA repair protein RecN (Recombination protein N)
MLRHLSIHAFALIEHVECSFGNGMTVLLGETGAGKSIIIDALAAALGERMSSDQLRTGARKAVIEASFTSSSPAVTALLEQHGLTWENADIVFRRELTSSGTSRCFVNDTPTQAAVVRAIAVHLMDFHGQHDTHGLLHQSRHLDIVDAVGGLADSAQTMASLWRDVVAARADLDALRVSAATAEADRHRLAFKLEELNAVNPQVGEDDEIAAELRRAESSELVIAHATALRETLYTGSASAYDQLAAAARHLDGLLPFAPELARFRDELDAAMTLCQEAAQAAAPLADPEDFSPARLEELRTRLVQLQRLNRTYGSLAEASAERGRLAEALNAVDTLDETIEQAQKRYDAAMAQATSHAKALQTQRKRVIKPLAESISTSLHAMGMPAATLTMRHATSALGHNGIDDVELLFSGNNGEPPRPLAKVASGGELSRVMLAIKRAMAQRGAIGTMVFDEIDTGISGKVARHVGDVMKELAAAHQILCITHLPQIASLADHVVRVTKTSTPTTTTVSAAHIEGEDAVLEIARLLSGVTVSDAALDSARELMSTTKR